MKSLRKANSRSSMRATLQTALAALIAVSFIATPLVGQGPRGNNRPEPLPLKSERKAKFTATEVTWMSLDVSPDGQTIVFDLLGDLYTLPITGGRAVGITKGLAFDAQPRFSPNGETIAFISDRSGGDNLWTMRMDFTDTTQITQGNTSLYLSPEWMPDGEHIVVSRSGGLGRAAKLQMHNVKRMSPLPVVFAPASFKTVGASPSPDGRYIWYAGRAGDWSYNALFPQYQLYRYDRETGQSTMMTSRYGSGFRPAISPDGQWLVYGTRENTETGLRKRNLTTGEEEWLAYPVQRDEMESRAPLDVLPGYSFTPDSRAVIVSYGGKIWNVPMDGSDATEIPFEVDVELDIGPKVDFAYQVDTSEMVIARQIRNPVASPDGSHIAFTAFDRLWVKEMPDGEARRLTTAEVGEYHPVWSPDGEWVAFVTWDDSAGGQIHKVQLAESGQPVQLTSVGALYYNLAWSLDGQRIVATRGAARELKKAPDIFFGPLGGEFVWIPAGGGDVTLIAPTGSRDVAHFNAAQPDRIYAYSPREGLVSFRWDGTDVKQHLRVRGSLPPGARTPHEEEWEQLPRRVFPVFKRDLWEEQDVGEGGPQPPPAGLVLISPTGDHALAQVGSHIYAMDMPGLNAPTPNISVANLNGAPVLVRKLTQIGGEFPSWSGDGNSINWGIGNAFFTYDLSRIQAIEDSTEQDARDKVARALVVRGIIDSLKATRSVIDSLKKADAEVPDSLEVKLNGLIADSVQVKADSLIRVAEEARARALAIRERADSVRAGVDSATVADTLYKPDEIRVEVTARRDMPQGTVVLRGGRVLTMKEHEIIENADIVVTNNRIVAVGARDSVEVPEGAEIVDVSGKTLIPGLVDTHYHAQWLVPEIHPEQTWQYLANLAYGVTTTRDPQTGSTDILSYQDRVETGGMVGPRIYSTGPGVFINEDIRNANQAKDVLKRYSEYYDTKTLKMYMSGNRQQRQWIIQAAKELELMPTTEGGLDFKLELTHAIDGYSGIEHSLPIAPVFSDVVELFKASQTTNSPTLLVSYGGPFGENYFYAKENVHDNEKMRRFSPHESIDARSRRRGTGTGGSPGRAGWFLDEEYVFPQHAVFVKMLLEDSARAAVGSHGQLQGLGYHWEMWAMGSGGASNHDILRAATIYGAEAIGFGKDLGTIEEGKLADILVLNEDPLADLRNTVELRYVMKNGRLYDADTLDEVWPRQRALPTPHWRAQGPQGVAAGIRN
ncbi:MAG: PD40 domain-containing protein [Gemmatimonadota bacterium]|nr:MAG: PD40 domain-containing protein [Gemmatimonadota bacterium]